MFNFSRPGLALLTGILLSATASAGIYKWTDASGKVHYTDQPPSGKKSQALNPNTALPDRAQDARKNLDIREQQFIKNREERLKKEAAAKQKKLAEKQRKKDCVKLRHNLQVYLTRNRVATIVDGKSVVVPYEERVKKMEKLRVQIERSCEGF